MLSAFQALFGSKKDGAAVDSTAEKPNPRYIKLRARSPVISCGPSGATFRLGIEEGTEKLWIYALCRDYKNDAQMIDTHSMHSDVKMIETTEDMKTLIICGSRIQICVRLLNNKNKYMETTTNSGVRFNSWYDHTMRKYDENANEPFYPQGHADFDKLGEFFTVIGAGGTGFPAAATPAA